MSLFHHHKDPDDQGRAEWFEVLGADRKILRYARNDFGEIAETTDPEEVRRLTELGYAILDERQEEGSDRAYTGEDVLANVEGLRVDGLFGHGSGTTMTSYTMGLLKEGAQGVPED